MPGDAASTVEGCGPTGMMVLVCTARVLHLKATRTSDLCEGSCLQARCTSSSTNTGLGRVGTTGKEEISIKLGNVSGLTLHKEQ